MYLSFILCSIIVWLAIKPLTSSFLNKKIVTNITIISDAALILNDLGHNFYARFNKLFIVHLRVRLNHLADLQPSRRMTFANQIWLIA